MRDFVADLKLFACGIGLGVLLCSAFVGRPDSTVCETVALVAVMASVALRVVQARLPRKHPQQQF
jgi:hypothetical protein